MKITKLEIIKVKPRWMFLKMHTGAELAVDGGMLAQLTPNINRELWK